MLFRNEAVVQHHGVVLVGNHQLFIPGHGAESHKAIRDGWRAEFFFAQLQQALTEASTDASHGAADHVGVGVFIHHAHEAVAHFAADFLQAFDVVLVVDVAHQVQAALALVFDDVGQRDYATHFMVFHHWQMVHVIVQHGKHGFEDVAAGADGNQPFGHDLADGGF